MATEDGSKQGATWPMPKFRFEVDLGTEMKSVAFQEISGMDFETQVIEYRHSNSKLFSTENAGYFKVWKCYFEARCFCKR